MPVRCLPPPCPLSRLPERNAGRRPEVRVATTPIPYTHHTRVSAPTLPRAGGASCTRARAARRPRGCALPDSIPPLALHRPSFACNAGTPPHTSPAHKMPKCAGTTKSGEACKRDVKDGSVRASRPLTSRSVGDIGGGCPPRLLLRGCARAAHAARCPGGSRARVARACTLAARPRAHPPCPPPALPARCSTATHTRTRPRARAASEAPRAAGGRRGHLPPPRARLL